MSAPAGPAPRRLRLEPGRRDVRIALAAVEARHDLSAVDMLELVIEYQLQLVAFMQAHPRVAFRRAR